MVREQSRRRFLQVSAAGATSVGMSSVTSQHSQAVPTSGGPTAVVQTGTIVLDRSDRGEWNRIGFGTPFTRAPVVVVQPVTARFGSVSLRKITRRGFECNFSGGQTDQALHYPQRLSYVAVARGRYTMTGTPLTVEAGFLSCDATPTTVTFDRSFEVCPVVFSQPQTCDTATAEGIRTVTATTPSTPGECSIRIDGPRTQAPLSVGYLAFEPGGGVLDPPDSVPEELLSRYEVNASERPLTDSWHAIRFRQRYDQPVVLTEIQSNADATTEITHVSDLDSSGGSVRLEDRRPTRASAARSERIGYGVFENEFTLYE